MAFIIDMKKYQNNNEKTSKFFSNNQGYCFYVQVSKMNVRLS